MTAMVFMTLGVLVVDLWDRFISWVLTRWGMTIGPRGIIPDRWFVFGIYDSGDLNSQRYWHFAQLKLPFYGYAYNICNDDYRWSRLYVAWWRGKFRYLWREVV